MLTAGIEPHHWSPAHRLYRALRSEAGIVPRFDTSQPSLSLSVLEDGNGTQLLVAINHGDAPLEGEEGRPQRPGGWVMDVESAEEMEAREGKFRLSLEPRGMRVLEMGR